MRRVEGRPDQMARLGLVDRQIPSNLAAPVGRLVRLLQQGLVVPRVRRHRQVLRTPVGQLVRLIRRARLVQQDLAAR